MRVSLVHSQKGWCVVRIWERFAEISKHVRQKHEKVGLYGHHDWVHAFRVGEVARQVALDEWGDEHLSHLAGVAGLCHNADRIIQKEAGLGRREVPQKLVRALVIDWLSWGSISITSVAILVHAVLEHDEKNSPEDSRVLIALMDADRVVNLDVDLFPRSGQYYHNLPVVDYKHLLDDPEATYRNPKSVLRDIAYSMDWADPTSPVCVRTRLGKKMAEERVKIFRTFFDTLQAQLAEEGIHPYPF